MYQLTQEELNGQQLKNKLFFYCLNQTTLVIFFN